MTAKIDNQGMEDANFIQYLKILSDPYDVTITAIDFETHTVEMNGPDEGMTEFAMVLAGKLKEYLV